MRLVFLAVLFLSLFALSAFLTRYYDEEALKNGIVVIKDADSKYEPIDKSDTYYRLPEGARVLVLKTRNGWKQIKRSDGRIGWVTKDAIEEI